MKPVVRDRPNAPTFPETGEVFLIVGRSQMFAHLGHFEYTTYHVILSEGRIDRANDYYITHYTRIVQEAE
jgi:hypothetical protein